jgi:malate dehydrogenase (oxaloacetate-decarboxylating)
MVKSMAKKPIIFGLANPTPEIMPDKAKRAGAAIVATGRSDLPNQVNNSLAFPGVFRGALDARARSITDRMKIAAAKAIADLVDEEMLTPDWIIPKATDYTVAPAVAEAVAREAVRSKQARVKVDPKEVAEKVLRFVYEDGLPPD